MISLQRSMHSSQMYTPGPAMSFLTCFWLFPQKEHLSRSPPSPNFATVGPPPCSRLAHPGRSRDRRQFAVRDHLVDDAVRLGFVGAHDEVAVRVARDLLDRLARVVREEPVEELPHPDDLLGLDLDVDGLTR